MDMVALKATARDTGVKPQELRRAGKVPCVVYGSKEKNQAILCDRRELTKAYGKAGESTLVELEVGSAKIPVLIHAMDLDPVSGQIDHVDFYAVDMMKEIEAKIPVRFVGEAPAVKELGAIFVVAHDHVTVRCLPKDLPHELTADISGLVAFHDVVTVAALKAPTGVTLKDLPETVLAVVQEPREEEVIEAPVAAVEGEAAVPGAEGAPAAEGAPGAPAAAAPEAKKEEKKK